MYWYDRDDNGKTRLVLEVKGMQEANKAFELKKDSAGDLYWQGHVTPVLNGNTFALRVEYPSSYPNDPPHVSIIDPRLPRGTPHLMSGQRMCIYHPEYAKKHGYYNPERTTAVNILGHAINWLMAFEVWYATGKWPIQECSSS